MALHLYFSLCCSTHYLILTLYNVFFNFRSGPFIDRTDELRSHRKKFILVMMLLFFLNKTYLDIFENTFHQGLDERIDAWLCSKAIKSS